MRGIAAPKAALAELYGIMSDRTLQVPVRLRSAISASRVEPVQPGEPPPAVAFLRRLLAHRKPDGKPLRADWRREASAALAYYERRAAKVALTFNITDQAETRRDWRRILNGCLRAHLWKAGRWPADRAILLGPTETFPYPPHPPELALSALLLPADPHKARRRRKAIDEPEAIYIADEQQRLEIVRSIAAAMSTRLAEFPPAPDYVRHARLDGR